MRAQQRRFDEWREHYNHERPHEALDDDAPADWWSPSRRSYTGRIAKPEYPGHCEVRRVSRAGCFRLLSKQIFLSNALADEHVGLEEVGDGIWNILFYQTLLGRYDEATNAITGTNAGSSKE